MTFSKLLIGTAALYAHWKITTPRYRISSENAKDDLLRTDAGEDLFVRHLKIHALLLCLYFYFWPRSSLYSHWSKSEIIALVLTFGGAGLREWAMETLGKYFTFRTGIQHKHELITDGPYSILIHPGYIGGMVHNLGLLYLVGIKSKLVLSIYALTMMKFLIQRMRSEEKMMIEHFGDSWERYTSTRWKWIPYLY